MVYTELQFIISPLQPAAEILIAELSDLGYESFVEEEDGLKAYIPEQDFNKDAINSLFVLSNDEFTISYQYKTIPEENWNAKWESDYDSVIIKDRCYIRAPFHESKPHIEFEIVIEPKMSFGTAHHETTAQMIQLLLEEDVKGKDVLDMGCGTAVLAILSKLKGAAKVCGIDNDEWAYNNSLENVQRNNFSEIEILLGDARLLKEQKYHVIIANINKNILLADMGAYSNTLSNEGVILFSGFYKNDLTDIKARALEYQLEYVSHLEENNWVAAKFQKK